MIRYEAPDGSLTDSPSLNFLRGLVTTGSAAYWNAGGNGEGVLPNTDSGAKLCIKQPPETSRFLLTFIHGRIYAVAHIGDAFGDFLLDERGGDPFRVPTTCLIDTATTVAVVVHFVDASSMLDTVYGFSGMNYPHRIISRNSLIAN